MEGLFALIFGLAALYFTLWLFILLPARMAEARGRSVVVWVLLSFMLSPFVAIVSLWLFGNAGKRST